MPEGFTVTSLDTGRAIDAGGHAGKWLPLRHELGITAFGVNAWHAVRAGDVAIERHDELTSISAPAHEELYVVLRGAARFTLGDEELEAPAGTVIFISDPGLVRFAVATEDDTLVLTVGGPPGSIEPSEWEGRWLRETGAG